MCYINLVSFKILFICCYAPVLFSFLLLQTPFGSREVKLYSCLVVSRLILFTSSQCCSGMTILYFENKNKLQWTKSGEWGEGNDKASWWNSGPRTHGVVYTNGQLHCHDGMSIGTQFFQFQSLSQYYLQRWFSNSIFAIIWIVIRQSKSTRDHSSSIFLSPRPALPFARPYKKLI